MLWSTEQTLETQVHFIFRVLNFKHRGKLRPRGVYATILHNGMRSKNINELPKSREALPFYSTAKTMRHPRPGVDVVDLLKIENGILLAFVDRITQ